MPVQPLAFIRRPRTALLAACLVSSLVVALLLPGRSTAAGSASLRAVNTGEWCALTIQLNTKYGTMKNKHYLAQSSPAYLKAFVNVVNAALAGRAQYLAVTPAEIKTAVTHEFGYFANLKASGFTTTTPLAPLTIGDVKKLIAFQKQKCGITFG
jgi:hypothetical protein